jgi:hypothetical protein
MSTERLVYALRQVMLAEQEEADARKDYTGCEWAITGFNGRKQAGKPATSEPGAYAVSAALAVNMAGELQRLRNHVSHWERVGIDGPALQMADAALCEYLDAIRARK